jgi:hypothetical protein
MPAQKQMQAELARSWQEPAKQDNLHLAVNDTLLIPSRDQQECEVLVDAYGKCIVGGSLWCFGEAVDGAGPLKPVQ